MSVFSINYRSFFLRCNDVYDANFWVHGVPSDELLGSKLSSRGQSLAYFLHCHQILKETVREAANRTIEKVEEFWARARVPTQDKGRAAKKVETLGVKTPQKQQEQDFHHPDRQRERIQETTSSISPRVTHCP